MLSWPGEWSKGAQIQRLARQRRSELVIVSGYSDLAHARMILWSAREGIPVMLWADSSIQAERAAGLRGRIKGWLLPELLSRCSAVLAWGTLGEQYFRKYGVPSERIFLVPPEPDYAAFEEASPQRLTAIREKYDLPKGRRFLMFCGRLAHEKRVDLLINAFAGVAHEHPEWDLLVVGDGPLREQLQQLAQDRFGAPSGSRVKWLGAVLNPADLAAVYKSADVFVLPSDFEPWGVVVSEAAAAGLALVCSDRVGAASELLRDGENGRLFRAGSSVSLQAAMNDAMNPMLLPTRKAASSSILLRWRTNNDPVKGLRGALKAVNFSKRP
ncbi:MAG TPA: glycosyltransferase family 4 protein [Tepidisphaeraceae bacterium]|nr:glycosyltransferase family 4 protein [Tepidisphaeraceae bacterium]